MKRKKKDLRAIIRNSIESDGATPYELGSRAQESGVCNRSTIYRYLSGESSISSDVLEWVLDDLGLAIAPRRAAKSSR